MTEVYIYPADCSDFCTIGLCGSLTPTSCLFEEVANGLSELTMVHPLDKLGKYKYLQNDCILSVMVPVRTTPEIDNTIVVQNVETYTIMTNASKDQRYVYSAKTDGKKLKLLRAGTKVTVTLKPATGDRWKIKTGQVSGWIDNTALDRSTKTQEYLPQGTAGIESVAPAWHARLQLFRIYSVDWSSENGITVKARHISYDLMYNITTYSTDGRYTLTQALNGIVNKCIDSVPYWFYTNIVGYHTGAHYADKDPITALLDPDEGLCALWDAKLVRDNNELFLLDNAGLDRGVTLEYGKNLTGVTMTADQSIIATRIRPKGRKKDGSALYLDTSAYPSGCVNSPLINNYPIQHVLTLDVPEATVSSDMSTATARQLMVEAAQKQFTNGVDKPKISVSVQFDLLGNSEKYAAFRELESVYLYDTVGIFHPALGINIKVDVVRTVWDCLRQKMQAVELGAMQALTSNVSSWQLSGGISGTKLLDGTVSGGQLSADAIAARHIQADSINADKIQADAITANKINADDLKANGATIEKLKAAWAEITGAYINTLTAGSITADTLAAALAQFTVITAGSASFDEATVRHLIASALNVQDATAGKVFISNLAADYASMVSAYVGNLCIKASDGNFYRLTVGTDGAVSAVLADVSEAEQAQGQTSGGQPIIETSITASDLSATDIKGVYALINRIDAERIDVDQLTARRAFIDYLRTSNLASNETIRIALDNLQATAEDAAAGVEDVRRYMEFSDSGLVQRVPGKIYYTLIDEDGFDVRSTQKVEPIATMNAEEGVKAERFTLGNIAAKRTATGGWAWQEVEG